MRTAFDAIASLARNIPRTAQIVMGYVPPSGFTWDEALWGLFPDSVHVRITPSAATVGLGVQVLDVERFDATPAQAPGWCVTQRKFGQIPTVYCSLSAWQSVQDAFVAARVAHPCYFVAAYPGQGPTLPVLNGIQAIGHQYASTALYDVSVVADYWPGVDGGEMLDANDPLVQRLLAAADSVMPGQAGVRSAGAEFLESYQADQDVRTLAGKVDALAAALAQVAATVAALDTGVASIQKQVAALAPPAALGGTADLTITLAPSALVAPGAAPVPQVTTQTYTINPIDHPGGTS